MSVLQVCQRALFVHIGFRNFIVHRDTVVLTGDVSSAFVTRISKAFLDLVTFRAEPERGVSTVETYTLSRAARTPAHSLISRHRHKPLPGTRADAKVGHLRVAPLLREDDFVSGTRRQGRVLRRKGAAGTPRSRPPFRFCPGRSLITGFRRPGGGRYVSRAQLRGRRFNSGGIPEPRTQRMLAFLWMAK